MTAARFLFEAALVTLTATLPGPLEGQQVPDPSKKAWVAPDTFYNTLSRTHPVVRRIRPGDTVMTRTLDALGNDEKGRQRAQPGNPMVGPFFVEGADPGDALIVRLLRVRMNRDWGWSSYRLGLNAVAPETIESLYPDRYKKGLVRPDAANLLKWEIDLARQTVRLRDPASRVVTLEFPARPMLGVIGVVPPGDFAPTSGPSGTYGGNLDFNEITEGATIYLPVYHPGALLYIGDAHALQADGEPTGTGIETSMDVQFTVEVRKGARQSGPRVETPTHLISIGSQPEFASSLDRALRLATSDMVRWLVEEYRLEPWAAHLLIGYQGEYEVITVAGSMGLKIPKQVLPRR